MNSDRYSFNQSINRFGSIIWMRTKKKFRIKFFFALREFFFLLVVFIRWPQTHIFTGFFPLFNGTIWDFFFVHSFTGMKEKIEFESYHMVKMMMRNNNNLLIIITMIMIRLSYLLTIISSSSSPGFVMHIWWWYVVAVIKFQL